MKSAWMGVFALTIMSSAAVAAAAPKPADPAEADRANPAYMWDLSDLYPSADAWKAAHDKAKAEVDTLETYQGTLGKNAASMLAAFDAISRSGKEIARLNVYATLKGDEDVRIAVNQERVQLGQALGARLSEKIAWASPEIIAIGAAKVHEFEKQSPELAKRFDFYLDNILRGAPHTLTPESEGVMSAVSNVLAQPNNIYSQLSNGELPFPSVTLSDGTKVEHLDQAAYTKYRQAPNRADRKLVFDTFWARGRNMRARSAPH